MRAVDDIWPAAVVLVAVAKKLRQQLPESALAVEVDAVIARTERAIDEHEQRALQDARTRAQIRELSRQVRS